MAAYAAAGGFAARTYQAIWGGRARGFYKAFISYKHEEGLPVSARLAQALRAYARPLFRPPMPIFRDEDHLVPSDNLPQLIRSSLAASEYLLLLASPEAAASVWVQDELRIWCGELERSKRLMIVLLRGDIVSDPVTKAVRWEHTSALPILLREFIDEVPLYVDLRRATSPEQLDLSDPDFKRAVNAISARLRGVTPDDLIGEEVLVYRRNIRVRNVGLAILAALAATALFFYVQTSNTLTEYQRLADTRLLEDARTEADALWPIHPNLVEKLTAWQARYTDLFARTPSHRQALALLRQSALPYADANQAQDRAANASTLRQIEAEIAGMDERLQAPIDDESRALETERRTALATAAASLRSNPDERHVWRFRELEDQFRHDVLARLVHDLAAFLDDGRAGVRSIDRRLELSRQVEAATLQQYGREWTAAAARVAANPHYAGVVLGPQMGLIPLGPDPASGLEEFLHWETNRGDVPRRDGGGRFRITADTGVILVLIPGGTFLMGAQSTDPAEPNFDPQARPNESPVRQVLLAPFFLSKYEMTQGQWLRSVEAENPSFHPIGFQPRGTREVVDGVHPVEQVSWDACDVALRRLGLALPTEAQWERAARADGETIYAGTSNIADLGQFANVAGQEAQITYPDLHTEHRDPFLIHAPVGALAPNAFGLYDMTGNEFEWCQDRFSSYDVEPRPGDGLRDSTERARVDRGGGFGYDVSLARIALRNKIGSSFREYSIGVRPARALEQP